MSFGRYSASGDCVAPQHAQVKALHIAVNVVRFAWLLHVICISFALSEVCAYASVTKTTKRHLMQLHTLMQPVAMTSSRGSVEALQACRTLRMTSQDRRAHASIKVLEVCIC